MVFAGRGQANPDVRHDRDWSNGTSGERRGSGELHKARYDADAAAIPRGTPLVRTPRARILQQYHSRHVDIVAVKKDCSVNRSRLFRGVCDTSNVSRISIQF